ncbi:hypothetical protein [Nocardia sp. NPDC057668]|uniref:hypothetical protein n=1 Tax=Nocardia sp. NPDC057668 TaxID=3346202 RepID=UPI00366E4D3C
MIQFLHRIEEMADDSGFLGLVDPHAYRSFVDEDWTLETLFGRFRSEMQRKTLLLWGTGGEDEWRIDVSATALDPALPVVRQAVGPITVTGGELVVVNYETVTMSAQFEDCAVDADKDMYRSGIELPNGDYVCTVSQLTDPTVDRVHDGPDFHLHLAAGRVPHWVDVAWFEL